MPLAQPSAAASATSCQSVEAVEAGNGVHSGRSAAGTHAGARLSRNAATPSLPFRRRAHARDALGRVGDRRASSIGCRATARISVLRRRLRLRAGEQQRAEDLVDRARRARPHGTMSWTRPMRNASAAVKRSADEEVAPRVPRADRLDHVRADRRRDQAELRLGQRERRVVRGDGDVAAGDEADAAAERRAVDAGDRRLGQSGAAWRASTPARSRRRGSRRGRSLAILFIQSRSAPAQKLRPCAEQDDGAHRVVGVERGAARASSSSISVSSNALWTSGRASTTIATALRTSTASVAQRPCPSGAPSCPSRLRAAAFGTSRRRRLAPWRLRHAHLRGRGPGDFAALAMFAPGPYIRKTPKVVGSIGAVERRREREPEHPARVGGVDDAVVPQPRAGVVRMALALVLRADRRPERLLVLRAPLPALGLDRVAADRRQHRGRLLAAHHRDPRVGPHPQEARLEGAAAHAVVAGAVAAADDDGELRHLRAGHRGDHLGAVAGDAAGLVLLARP